MRQWLRRSGLLLLTVLAPACGGGGSKPGPIVPIVLLAPTGFTSYSSIAAITLHWNPVIGATGYVLYSATQPGITPANYGTLAGGQRTVVLPDHHFSPITGATTYYFVLAATAGGVEGPPSAEISDAQSFPTVTPQPIQGTLYTLSGTLRDIVYDPVHQRAYATNETASSLEILDLASDALAAPLPLGAQPWGLDITTDCSRLFVCLRSSSEIAVVDLTVIPPVVLTKVTVTADATGASSPRRIGIAANGRAFFTCVDAGAGYSILREMNLGTLAISQRTDLNGGQLRDPTYIGVSQDRSRIVFGQGGTGGDYSYYTSATDTFTGGGKVPVSIVGASANADGSRFTLGPYLVDSTLRIRGLVSQFAAVTMVFSPTLNRGYLGAGGSVIDLDLLRQVDTIATPGSGVGEVKVDPTGKRLFATCSTGILQVPLDVNHPPRVISGSGMTASFGESIAWTLEAVDPDGDPIEFCAQNLPANTSFDPVTRRLTFTPSLAQVGTIIPNATIFVTDGRNATSTLVGFSALNPPSHPFCQFPFNKGLVSGVTDLVHDPVRDRVYLAYTTNNTIERIQAATNTRLDPVVCLGAPQSVDLNSAATRMVVCPANAEYVQVFDLTVEPPVLVANIPVPDGPTPDHRRPDRVAVAANGHALISTTDVATGASRLLDLDLSTNLLIIRGDVPGGTIPARPLLRASRDRSMISTLCNATPQTGFIYGSASNAFGSLVTLAGQALDLDVNTDGSRILTCGGPRVYDGSLSSLGLVSGSGLRAAVRQGTTTGFRAFISSTIEILDLPTFAVTGSFTVAGSGFFGPMITDGAGARLFMTPPDNFAIVTLP
jgi:hypothetical protein